MLNINYMWCRKNWNFEKDNGWCIGDEDDFKMSIFKGETIALMMLKIYLSSYTCASFILCIIEIYLLAIMQNNYCILRPFFGPIMLDPTHDYRQFQTKTPPCDWLITAQSLWLKDIVNDNSVSIFVLLATSLCLDGFQQKKTSLIQVVVHYR